MECLLVQRVGLDVLAALDYLNCIQTLSVCSQIDVL